MREWGRTHPHVELCFEAGMGGAGCVPGLKVWRSHKSERHKNASEDERAFELAELHEAALLTPKQHGVFVVFKVVGSSAAMPVLPSKRSGLRRLLGPTTSG